jgi:hypothetical protein
MKITATKNSKKNNFTYPTLMIRGKYKDVPDIEGEIYLINSKDRNGCNGIIIFSPKAGRVGLYNNWDSNAMEVYHGKVTLEN